MNQLGVTKRIRWWLLNQPITNGLLLLAPPQYWKRLKHPYHCITHITIVCVLQRSFRNKIYVLVFWKTHFGQHFINSGIFFQKFYSGNFISKHNLFRKFCSENCFRNVVLKIIKSLFRKASVICNRRSLFQKKKNVILQVWGRWNCGECRK